MKLMRFVGTCQRCLTVVELTFSEDVGDPPRVECPFDGEPMLLTKV